MTSYCLGLVFLLGLHNMSSPFGLYLMILSGFHLTEFLATALGNPHNLSWDSFLVNHSVQYWAAMVVSWLEHLVWSLALPSIKTMTIVTSSGTYFNSLITYKESSHHLGLVMCLLGEIIRKAAMLEAGRSFNHIVQSEKRADHQLVTSGVYSWCRHPSYAGWFIWSVGTQVSPNHICHCIVLF